MLNSWIQNRKRFRRSAVILTLWLLGLLGAGLAVSRMGVPPQEDEGVEVCRADNLAAYSLYFGLVNDTTPGTYASYVEHQPLYFISQKVWRAVFGESLGSIRALSIFYFVAAYGVFVLWVAIGNLGVRTILPAALFVTSSSLLDISWWIRPHSLYLLMALLLFLSFEMLLKEAEPPRLKVLFFLSVAIAAVFTHFLLIPIVLLQIIWIRRQFASSQQLVGKLASGVLLLAGTILLLKLPGLFQNRVLDPIKEVEVGNGLNSILVNVLFPLTGKVFWHYSAEHPSVAMSIHTALLMAVSLPLLWRRALRTKGISLDLFYVFVVMSYLTFIVVFRYGFGVREVTMNYAVFLFPVILRYLYFTIEAVSTRTLTLGAVGMAMFQFIALSDMKHSSFLENGSYEFFEKIHQYGGTIFADDAMRAPCIVGALYSALYPGEHLDIRNVESLKDFAETRSVVVLLDGDTGILGKGAEASWLSRVKMESYDFPQFASRKVIYLSPFPEVKKSSPFVRSNGTQTF